MSSDKSKYDIIGTHAHTFVRMCVTVYACICVCECVTEFVYGVFLYVCVPLSKYACMCVCVRVYLYVNGAMLCVWYQGQWPLECRGPALAGARVYPSARVYRTRKRVCEHTHIINARVHVCCI